MEEEHGFLLDKENPWEGGGRDDSQSSDTFVYVVCVIIKTPQRAGSPLEAEEIITCLEIREEIKRWRSFCYWLLLVSLLLEQHAS